MWNSLLKDAFDRLVRDGTTETRSINLIELLLQLPVGLSLVFYFLDEIISVYILLLRLYLYFAQLLL